MTFTPDAKLLITGSRDETIKLFDMPHMAEQRTLKGHTAWVRALAVTADSKVLISAGDDATIRFWDLSNGRSSERSKPIPQPFAASLSHLME